MQIISIVAIVFAFLFLLAAGVAWKRKQAVTAALLLVAAAASALLALSKS